MRQSYRSVLPPGSHRLWHRKCPVVLRTSASVLQGGLACCESSAWSEQMGALKSADYYLLESAGLFKELCGVRATGNEHWGIKMCLCVESPWSCIIFTTVESAATWRLCYVYGASCPPHRVTVPAGLIFPLELCTPQHPDAAKGLVLNYFVPLLRAGSSCSKAIQPLAWNMKFPMTMLLPESRDTVIPTHSSNNCHMVPHKVQKLIIKSLEQALEELCYYVHQKQDKSQAIQKYIPRFTHNHHGIWSPFGSNKRQRVHIIKINMNLSGKDSFKPKGKRLYYFHYQFNISRASSTSEHMPSARRSQQWREIVGNVCFFLKLFVPITTTGFLTKLCKIWAFKVLLQSANKRQNAAVCDPTMLLLSLFLNELLWSPLYVILRLYRRCHRIQYCL